MFAEISTKFQSLILDCLLRLICLFLCCFLLLTVCTIRSIIYACKAKIICLCLSSSP
ncbi:hypothetical protein RchiOBHm_Chr1g0329381 [Rosa chinensis]|uniref:Uncharacterized protein n=1 Tax=Rosa chinensis TaxID=74649 RepID=A0A2P6SB02_ROSCH|nr:hypothetical protein RchiOBHm_Chr1g0329381 [Rosa chinensis]